MSDNVAQVTNLPKHRRNTRQVKNLSYSRRRRAVVLIIVLVVVVALSLTAYSFARMMISSREGAELNGNQIQARVLADSGVEAVRAFLLQDEQTQLDAGGTYDNAVSFQGLLVFDDTDPRNRGRTTVIAPAIDDQGIYSGVRYGLTDESTRLNLNALTAAELQQEDGGRELLKALPGMTDEIADAILDWIDEDDEPREFGAEVDYYSGLTPPYAPKNGPMATVEELLLVRGVVPQLLFGLDVNRNGTVDPHESGASTSDAFSTLGVDASDGSLDLGWSAYLTLYSQEKNVTLDGSERIDVNSDDLEQLYEELSNALSPQWATFIVAYRQNGPYTGKGEAESASGELDLTKPAKVRLNQVLDLVGVKTRVTFEGEEDSTILASPISEEAIGLELPTLMDNVTTNPAPVIPGRININQAPRAILEGIPGMETEIVDAIISRRDIVPDDADPNRRHETWILAEGIVELDEMRALLPFVNVGGDVYRAHVVGYFEGGGASSRAEVIFDATGSSPRILFWRDVSHLGRGYALETLGVEAVE